MCYKSAELFITEELSADESDTNFPYDDAWRERFAEERLRLAGLIGNLVKHIQQR